MKIGSKLFAWAYFTNIQYYDGVEHVCPAFVSRRCRMLTFGHIHFFLLRNQCRAHYRCQKDVFTPINEALLTEDSGC